MDAEEQVASENNILASTEIEELYNLQDINNSLSQNEITCQPKEGMSFKSVLEFKDFYKKYAYQQGFGFVTRSSRKNSFGEVCNLILACARQGHYTPIVQNSFKSVASIRAQCGAHVTACLKYDGLYHITKVVLGHSHNLSPSKGRLFRSNREISMHVKRVLDVNDRAGVRLNKSFHSIVTDAGGYEKLAFSERDARNYITKERRAIGKGGDGEALKDYFVRMQEKNSDFFYDIDLDNDFHIRNVFWADAKSRATYASFGDVITFDTTYLTNKYDMPFAAFVGVNHHGQSVLLGCGLLSSEDTESFVWLFKSWLRCMSGVSPQAIITDQCYAMKNAIGIVFPITRHRWCLWHIMKKVPQKLSWHNDYLAIIHHLQAAIYDTFTQVEFEEQWKNLIINFNLHENDWLSGLYVERHRWVPILLKHQFWAGMSTTQRSESIHAFFDGYVHHSATLEQFVNQYDNALRDKAEKEFQADFQSSNSTMSYNTKSPIERQFQAIYTHAKLKEVQAEFRATTDCHASLTLQEGSVCTYKVVEDMLIRDKAKEVEFTVVLNRDNHDMKCKCLLFEFRGIVCRHSLVVLGIERVKEMPSKYVLLRWSKNIKRRHTYIKSSYDVKQLKPQMQRFDDICKDFYEVGETAAEYEDTTCFLQKTLQEVKSKLKIMVSYNKKYQISTADYPTCNENDTCERPMTNNTIHSPNIVRRAGRPTSKRKVSIIEQAVKSSTKRKKNMQSTQMQEKATSLSSRECQHQHITRDGSSYVSLLSSFQPSAVVSFANIDANSTLNTIDS